MHQSVLDAFTDFSVRFEGKVHWLYLDILGLVTTGVGNLVDPVQAALYLPWLMPDGSPASFNEIATQWRALKARQDLAKLHFNYAAPITTMRLTDDGIAALVKSKLLANEKAMQGYFPLWNSWPADAQLAASSMAWAVGAGFPRSFGNFTAAANRQDWISALAACKIREDNNPGLVPRNAANRLCLSNAASVIAQGLPLDALHWPATAPNASQRDQALQVEADEAAKAHAETLDKLTSDALAAIDLRADHDAPDFS